MAHRQWVLFVVVVAALAAPAAAPAQAPPKAQELIAVLQSEAPTFDKARACQQLAGIAGKEAVPALAALLGDEKLAAYARSALEAVPDASAGQALLDSLGKLRGRLLVGAINSLGVRRDVAAVPALRKLAAGANAETAGAALATLGQIATPEAAAAVQQALASSREGTRAAAGDACLTCGDRQLAAGRRSEADRLYDGVRRAKVPEAIRLAATQRLIAARQAAGLPLLLELLHSPDAAAMAMGLRAVRQVPGPEVSRALVAALPKLPLVAQVPLVQALAERPDAPAQDGIEALAANGAPEVRPAAIRALGVCGRASCVPVLLKALGGEEADTAAASLAQLSAAGTDDALVKALPEAPPAARARLAGILGSRRAAGAAGAVLKLAGDPDPAVSKAAFVALATLSRPQDLAEILRLMAGCKDAAAREAAERAASATLARIPDAPRRDGLVLAALKNAPDTPTRCALVGLLGESGDWGAYTSLKPMLGDPEPAVRDAALHALAEWPDATPAGLLLRTALGAADPAQRSLALRAAVKLAGAAGDTPWPSQQAIGWLTQANQAVRPDAGEKRLILSGLAGLKCAEGLRLAQPYLEDAAVAPEAAVAVVQIARGMPKEQQPLCRPALEKVAAQAKDQAVRTQAQEALKAIPASVPAADPGALTFRSLFDGKTFDGWEGDTEKSFRIQDGAIVGGSLKAPVPRNEFLCTTRPYANFVLRLECKVIAANGGIQIRSVRVPRSAEMCGYQADMDSSGRYWGCLYDESRRGMLAEADAAAKKAVKAGDWNAYEIRCEGPRIRLSINGVQTVEYMEKDQDILLSGLIGVQVHAGGPSETWYRNISIAELP